MGRKYELKEGCEYIAYRLDGYKQYVKIKVIEETKSTYLIKNIDNKGKKFRISKDNFDNWWHVEESLEEKLKEDVYNLFQQSFGIEADKAFIQGKKFESTDVINFAQEYKKL